MGWVEVRVQSDPHPKNSFESGGPDLLAQLGQGHLTPTQYIAEWFGGDGETLATRIDFDPLPLTTFTTDGPLRRARTDPAPATNTIEIVKLRSMQDDLKNLKSKTVSSASIKQTIGLALKAHQCPEPAALNVQALAKQVADYTRKTNNEGAEGKRNPIIIEDAEGKRSPTEAALQAQVAALQARLESHEAAASAQAMARTSDPRRDTGISTGMGMDMSRAMGTDKDAGMSNPVGTGNGRMDADRGMAVSSAMGMGMGMGISREMDNGTGMGMNTGMGMGMGGDMSRGREAEMNSEMGVGMRNGSGMGMGMRNGMRMDGAMGMGMGMSARGEMGRGPGVHTGMGMGIRGDQSRGRETGMSCNEMGVGIRNGSGMGMGMDMEGGIRGGVPMWAYMKQQRKLTEMSIRNENARIQAASDRQRLVEMSCAQPNYF